ncbi:cache domain-containing sensor histidine kinase [Paenibacillus mucilaginosus]|uniref:Putative sensor with HAMP domain n=1 Tax=Paenibacillus mucilaginosus (strain KNP414) TaxID=1036673 RepID=F8FK98_PAEMK|nr:sensor histidine kinase [Paenibacillus mucilaginosus]AEI44779.1 putative sensor with HAMP domain [Paenibacillus mucilaginosus KNP414]MCG7214829.1 sensor histidine kinase [Paenibacillus mucilaginosus]WDM26312.1 sensor histidine kinase [Paenibacillus mucilaginosus]
MKLIRSLWGKWKESRLFVKLIAVMVVSIVAVSATTSWITLHMSVKLFTDTFGITNAKVISQIKTNMDSFHYTVITAANNVFQSGTVKSFLTEGDSDSLTMARQYGAIRQEMDRIQSIIDAYQVSITISGVNGRSYSTDRSLLPLQARQLEGLEMTRRALEQPKKMTYQYYRPGPSDVGSKEPLIVATQAIRERSTGEVYGTLYVAVRESDFRQFYASFSSVGNDVFLLDRTGLIVSSNREDYRGEYTPDLLRYASQITEQQVRTMEGKVWGKDSIILAEELPFYDVYLVNVIDSELASGQMLNKQAIVLTCSLFVLGALVIVFLITRGMTRSLTLLVRQMSRITENDFTNYVSVTGSYETRQVGHAFNYMLDELHEYVDELVATQKEQRNAELAALQRQINPHFLYNTLASVKFLVQQDSKEKAAATIHALITLLQNAIGNVSETVTVEQEISNLKSYVFINHVRYGDRVRANFFIAPDCLHYHVPKLMIQPFIENAFFHGFNRKQQGTVHVLVAREGETLVCEVVDNGDGIEGLTGEHKLPADGGKSHFFSGIGIQNVHDRIQLLYGEPYGVAITSRPGEGTRVKIRLPLLES